MRSDLTKPFWVFEFDNYYPSGGLADISDTFDTLEEAVEYINREPDWREPDYKYILNTNDFTADYSHLVEGGN